MHVIFQTATTESVQHYITSHNNQFTSQPEKCVKSKTVNFTLVTAFGSLVWTLLNENRDRDGQK